MKTYLMMAGGTGGHVFPALATARKLQEQGANVAWLGSNGGFEQSVIEKQGIPFYGISVSGLRGKGKLALLKAPFNLVHALIQAFGVLNKVKPHLVVGMGGFASGPGGLAARLSGRPLVVHEQNAVAGMTNRILAKIAKAVYEAFPNSFGSAVRATLIGNPIREEIVALNQSSNDKKWDASRQPRILVVGGSLGAQKLNEVVPAAMALLDQNTRPEIIHQSGKGKLKATQSLYEQLDVQAKTTEFIDDMADAYSWADLVICRAGALTVSELAAAGLGAVFVPFPHAVDDHQTLNAKSSVDAGAAHMIAQSELTAERLNKVLVPLFEDQNSMRNMAAAALSIAKPNAARDLAEECGRLARV
ncbi:UDP-N-acetylglucosamine--N-acetylmuramyl-(pentapeptide) pyrophosphoryl-undecaprenol N-acetylglucosamine transferase [Oleiphilus sp. HI0009]|nr:MULTISPECIES: undecaprenyldiphospho-muramoylpentapeptide beta-N-acetylglucosaminyltransferase [unclassified Oleiphilus]KZX81400.1 UDP-N-acetylglucosamine--N-acetylmuramyl-(pentapeptide) pyrophosphoryl-undecaprenol N-acetylglucosamine transferase [Oleiphilus sp. HI0009]KZY65796.1 UDP-N-acetylglucosamine--N-acetylmuramyl-(pentapeptide) pyrophosphoryl-undecaprenol N-acetylglucosamine transferase [Oleiphilus sp. HI0066]KZY70520.1 UDP-N-acetylglucosamine--N-acetylmuramyl-(pentapeptide) pyrophospho